MKYLFRRWNKDHWEILVLRLPFHKKRTWIHIDRYMLSLSMQKAMRALLPFMPGLSATVTRQFPMYSITQALKNL